MIVATENRPDVLSTIGTGWVKAPSRDDTTFHRRANSFVLQGGGFFLRRRATHPNGHGRSGGQ